MYKLNDNRHDVIKIMQVSKFNDLVTRLKQFDHIVYNKRGGLCKQGYVSFNQYKEDKRVRIAFYGKTEIEAERAYFKIFAK